jgi:Cys-rich repeat protein
VSREFHFILVLLLAGLPTAACQPVTWSFDQDGSAEASDAPALDVDSEGSIPESDAARGPPDSGSGADASLAPTPDAEAVPEAASPCAVDSDCPLEAPLCSASGVCFRCAAASDCAGDGGNSRGRVCNASTGACVQCTANSDCSSGSELPYCYSATNRCVQCLSSAECGFESICQLATHTCTKMF